MAILTTGDFNKILTDHGRNAIMHEMDDTPQEATTFSAFDMIYGYVDEANDSGQPAYRDRTFKALIQEVQTGQESWITPVGSLEIGDALLFCKPTYEDGIGVFRIVKDAEIVDSVSGKTYIAEVPANNIDGSEIIFLQVSLKKKVV